MVMDNRLNDIRRKISFLRSEMLATEVTIRKQINRDEDCTEASLRLMAMRTTMLGLIGERDSLGGSERLLDVEERLKAEYCAVSRKPLKVRSAAVNDDPLPWKIAALRGQLLELGSAVRQLNQAGLDSGAAQLLLVRKRAELEGLMKLAKRSSHS
jgi:hypothetical protein